MSFKEMNDGQIKRFVKFFQENHGGVFDFKKWCYRINGNECASTEEAFLAVK